MSVREYIGARYVPVFADPAEWDATKTYEPLTVVLYQGNSYTSRQSVPANIPITNTTYWAQTGNYNAQVEQYRSEVATFDGRITTNATAISAETTAREQAITAETTAREQADTAIRALLPSTDFTSENTVKNYIDAEIHSVDNQFESLQDYIDDSIRKRTFILLGDSFGGGISSVDNVSDPTRKGWIKHTAEYLTNYAKHVYYFGYGGDDKILPGVAGFASSLPFQTMLQNLVESGNIENNYEVTDIIVLGGTNDQAAGNEDSVIRTAIRNFCNYAHTTFPNAKIGIGVIGSLTVGDGLYHMREVYRYCTYCGAYYIRSLANLYCDSEYNSDGTHLTQAGYAFYDHYVADAVIHGETSYEFFKEVQIHLNSDRINFNIENQLYSSEMRMYENGFRINIVAPGYGGFCAEFRMDTSLLPLGATLNDAIYYDASILVPFPWANLANVYSGLATWIQNDDNTYRASGWQWIPNFRPGRIWSSRTSGPRQTLSIELPYYGGALPGDYVSTSLLATPDNSARFIPTM
jgi:hypothetical protein